MPWSDKYSDTRYEATREDVLWAVGPVEPNPLSGPDDPDPFGHNERPWTEFLIATRIAEHHKLRHSMGKPGEGLKLNRLQDLLAEMVADGSIVGRPRYEWSAMGRDEPPSRERDVMYASVEHAARWTEEDGEAL